MIISSPQANYSLWIEQDRKTDRLFYSETGNMKRLVLLGEGHGEVAALPIMVRRLLKEKGTSNLLFVDNEVIRTSPTQLVKWNKSDQQTDHSLWIKRVKLAAQRKNVGGILAIYDGDAKTFPPGSGTAFCASTAAKSMAVAAASAGAGKVFSLCVVFACSEYETWLVAGAESLAGRQLNDGRLVLPAGIRPPEDNPESRGKGWLEDHCISYRPTRDQAPLTEMLDFEVVRSKRLRSFQRLEHAIELLIEAVAKGHHISSPC